MDSANGDPVAGNVTDHVEFFLVGDTFESVSTQRATANERVYDLVQYLWHQELGGGWFATSNLDGIYCRYVRDYGLQPIPWSAVARALSRLPIRKRRKEFNTRLPDGSVKRSTEIQYWIPPPPKKKKPPAE